MSKHWQAEWSDERSKRIKADQQIATLRDQLATVTLERDALRRGYNVRTWSQAMSAGWHKAIPDTSAAFTALLAAIDAALQEKP